MNEAIAITNATLGIVLLLVLFLRVRDVGAELNLKKYRSKDAGLADLLNYAAMVDDGVIVARTDHLSPPGFIKVMIMQAVPMSSGI